MSGKKLIKIAMNRYKIPEKLAKSIITNIFSDIEDIVKQTGRCQIRGFGTFKLKKRAEKRFHDYASKKIITIPEKIFLSFSHARDRLYNDEEQIKLNKVIHNNSE